MALALALKDQGSDAVVINADSAQVYADLSVLSARPGEDDMKGIEHCLFGAWDGAVACSAAEWAQAARTEITRAHRAGAVPILVGGTGLYIRTLLDGIAPVPEIAPEVRAAVRALPVDAAYAALAREDPERAAALSPNDSARIARALEVVRSTGAPLSHWQAHREGGMTHDVALHPAILLPPRDVLYDRCDRRFAAMVERGGVNEVRALLERNLDPALPVMKAIGVPELAAFLRGESSLEDAVLAASQSTRRYAKRQYTWMRRQPPSAWMRVSEFDFKPRTLFASLFQ